MSGTTHNYSFVQPTVGGDASTWGATLNNDLSMIDGFLFANTFSMSINAVGSATLPTFSTASANFTVNKAPGTNLANINGASNGVLRWVMSLGDATAEGGSNAGSDFDIRNCDNSGTIVGSVFTIQRSSGAVSINGNGATPYPSPFSTTAANFTINKAGSGSNANLNGMSNGALRWQINLGNTTPEGGSNTGSDFAVNNFSDPGSIIGSPLTIQRSSGAVSINQYGATLTTGTFSPTTAANFSINKAGSGANTNLTGMSNGVARWQLNLGNAQTESGSNTGSDFAIVAYGDTGGLLGYPLAITRSTQAVTFTNTSSVTFNTPSVSVSSSSGANSQIFLNKAGSGTASVIAGQLGAVNRWMEYLGNSTAEGGSNTGSDYALGRFADGGGVIDFPLTIVRSTGVATFSKTIVNGPSDRSLKENIEPLEDALAKVQALQGVSFDWISNGRRDIGLIAQDVQPIVPEIVQTFGDEGKLALDYPKLTALLIEAVKTLSARVEALEERLA
jgi:hypothetical protein